MDILLNSGFMPIVLVATAIGFIAYSAIAVRKRGVKAYFGQLGRGIVLISVFLCNFLIKAVGLLARSTKTTHGNAATNNAARGGIYNYRTRKFDKGTDPAGLYDED
jgi:hypothetical protein